MGICCSKSRFHHRSEKYPPKLSRHVTLRPEQPDELSTDKRLQSLIPDDVADIPHKGELIRIRVIKVYDGDTLTFIFLHGGIFPLKLRMRIINIDAPEIKGRGVSELHSEAGKAVRDVVTYLTNNKILWARINKWDKYGGRVDGDVFLDLEQSDEDPHGVPLSSWLIEHKLVHPYIGTSARDEWTDEELGSIIVQSQKLLQCWG